MTITHSSLCDTGLMILKDMIQCDIYGRDIGGGKYGEHLDAGGTKGRDFHKLECKVSREDFRADARKPSRQPGQGVGNLCSYVFPEELNWQSLSIPDYWGVYEVRNGEAFEVLEATWMRPNFEWQFYTLLSLMRKERREQPTRTPVDKWLDDAVIDVVGGTRISAAASGSPLRNPTIARKALKDRLKANGYDIISGRAVRRVAQ